MEKISWTTTVVGSFPYENTPNNMKSAFQDQLKSQIEYPCYPQLVGMIEQFLDPLTQLNSGLRKTDKLYSIDTDLSLPSQPVALEYGQFVLNYLKNHPEAAKQMQGWKACLTGPFTLAGGIIVPEKMVDGKQPIIFQEHRAIMSESVLNQIADFMASVAQAYVDMGASIISMDEPSLGLIVGKRKILYHTDDVIIDILNRAIAPITRYSSIHICGRISPRLRDILLSSNVNIMDHEFVGTNNDGLFTKQILEESNKTLAVGVIESNVAFNSNATLENCIESPEILAKRIQKAINLYGKENIILKPDCGFGGLLASFGQEMASEMVRRKLQLLSSEMKKF